MGMSFVREISAVAELSQKCWVGWSRRAHWLLVSYHTRKHHDMQWQPHCSSVHHFVTPNLGWYSAALCCCTERSLIVPLCHVFLFCRKKNVATENNLSIVLQHSKIKHMFSSVTFKWLTMQFVIYLFWQPQARISSEVPMLLGMGIKLPYPMCSEYPWYKQESMLPFFQVTCVLLAFFTY